MPTTCKNRATRVVQRRLTQRRHRVSGLKANRNVTSKLQTLLPIKVTRDTAQVSAEAFKGSFRSIGLWIHSEAELSPSH